MNKSAPSSESLRKEIGDFHRSFATRAKCQDPIDTAETAAVASIIKISEISPASRMLVSKALVKGTGLSRDDLADMAKGMRDGRETTERTAIMGDLDYISYHGLLEIITEMVCSCESDTAEAISAINDLSASEMDLSECERIIDALAIERYSWDKCFRELGGPAYAIFVRMINFKNQIKSIFPGIIQEFEFITSHEKGLKMPRVKVVHYRIFLHERIDKSETDKSALLDFTQSHSFDV